LSERQVERYLAQWFFLPEIQLERYVAQQRLRRENTVEQIVTGTNLPHPQDDIAAKSVGVISVPSTQQGFASPGSTNQNRDVIHQSGDEPPSRLKPFKQAFSQRSTGKVSGIVISKLSGGLGNQLFQYATGRALADYHGVPLKLDISHYNKHRKRSYRLDKFRITASLASPDEVKRLTSNKQSIFQRKRRYSPEIWQTPRQIYLRGHWLSEKYFKNIALTLRQELTLKQPIDPGKMQVLHLMSQVGSVSLHIRRGDYLSNKLFDPLPLDYYDAALKKLAHLIQPAHIFIFSDDILWAQQNLALDYPTTYMAGNQDYEDLWFMSQCKHHIVANSIFSWWGAWLCSFPGQIVVAPKKWFANIGAVDPVPETWHRV
jgi:hypothetical protein